MIQRDEILYRVTAPHFVAGAIARNGIVIRTAPILHRLRLRSVWQAADMCRRAGWIWALNDASDPAADEGLRTE